MILIILFYVGINLVLAKLSIYGQFWQVLSNFWSLFNIDCMAIGGIFSVIYYDGHNKISKILFRKIVFFPVVLITVICLICGIKFSFLHYEVYAFLFGVIIFNLACNEDYKKMLEYKLPHYLGSISYGMYMYHLIALQIGIQCAIYFKNDIFVYLITIPLTILFSAISYEYFEKYFLKFKRSHV